MLVVPGPEGVFSAWADWRVLQRRPPSAQTLALYRSFWTAWCRHLAELAQPLAWSNATPANVVAYLAAEKREVTQARYKRLLTEVYAFSVVQGWAVHNPAAPSSPEVASREQPVSSAMHLLARDRFVAALAQAARAPVQLRDAALVVLLAIEGLSIGEALALRLGDLQPSASAPHALHLGGQRRAQARKVTLDTRTVQALQAWLTAAAPHINTHLASQPLLADLRAATNWTRPLSRHAGFRIVRTALARAVELGHLDTAPAEHGPQVLRNSALLAWLEHGVSPAEVQRRAGLQRLDGLDRIVKTHGFGDVLERFKAQRRTELGAGLPDGRA
jgi:site-specific recombinase XerD